MEISIFGLACSLREESLNERLLKAAAAALKDRGDVGVETAKLTEFSMPLYNADIQDREGIPQSAHRLREAVETAGNVIVATPEYNHSVGAPLKNAIDWTSRFRPNPWAGTRLLLMSAAPSRFGGLRGLEQTRVPFEALGTDVFATHYGLSGARKAFDDNGRLVDDNQRIELDRVLDRFVTYIRREQGDGDDG